MVTKIQASKDRETANEGSPKRELVTGKTGERKSPECRVERKQIKTRERAQQTWSGKSGVCNRPRWTGEDGAGAGQK